MTSIKTVYKKNFNILMLELIFYKLYPNKKFLYNYSNMSYNEVAKEEFKLYKKFSKEKLKTQYGIEYLNELDYNDIDWNSFILFYYSYIYQVKYKNDIYYFTI